MTILWAIYIIGLAHLTRVYARQHATHPLLIGRIGCDLGRTAALMCWPVPFVVGFWRGMQSRL